MCQEFQKFKLTDLPKITVQPAINVALKGVMDVGTNHRRVWHNVHSTIYIKEGKTISISLNDNETNRHQVYRDTLVMSGSFTLFKYYYIL